MSETRRYTNNYSLNTSRGRTFGRCNVGGKIILKCVSKFLERERICIVSGSVYFSGMGFCKFDKWEDILTSWSTKTWRRTLLYMLVDSRHKPLISFSQKVCQSSYCYISQNANRRCAKETFVQSIRQWKGENGSRICRTVKWGVS